jgi:hypothetical protein
MKETAANAARPIDTLLKTSEPVHEPDASVDAGREQRGRSGDPSEMLGDRDEGKQCHDHD